MRQQVQNFLQAHDQQEQEQAQAQNQNQAGWQ